MSKLTKPVVVYAPPFNENSGGCVVLHLLVHKLREKGINAFLCPYRVKETYLPVYEGFYRKIPKRFRNRTTEVIVKNLRIIEENLKRLDREKVVSQLFETPIASKTTKRNAVVLYPESIDGNPLGAKDVVRWLLNVPGYINKGARFGEGEELFYFDKKFKGPYLDLPESRFLKVFHIRKECYYEPTPGSARPIEYCFLVWKGARHGVSADELRKQNKIVIDGLSHEEIGKILRNSKCMISYTPNSMYNTYAILCGCTPILCKPPGMESKEFSLRTSERLPGIAVGFKEVAWARDTKLDFFEHLKRMEENANHSLNNFVDFLHARYG